jgi:hypothetical protein
MNGKVNGPVDGLDQANLMNLCFLHVVHKCSWEDMVSSIFAHCPSDLTAVEALFVGIIKRSARVANLKQY